MVIRTRYAKVEAVANTESVVPPTSWNANDLSDWFSTQLSDILPDSSLSPTVDLFEQGLDRYLVYTIESDRSLTSQYCSLSTTILRRRIVGAMQSSGVQKANQAISNATIYDHPTIEILAQFISGIVEDPDTFVLTSSKTDIIEAMISKYSTGLNVPIPAVPLQAGGQLVVLLTGSTGNLGSQMLASLLRDARVKTVYALNRPSSGSRTIQQRQAERFADKALDISLLSSDRLVYLEGEASHAHLGLRESVYHEVCMLSSVPQPFYLAHLLLRCAQV